MNAAAETKTPAAGAAFGAALWAQERRRAPLWTPVLFGLGVQSYVLAPAEPSLVALFAALAGAAALLVAARSGGEARLAGAVALACLLAGFGWAGLRAHAVAAPVLFAEHEGLVEGRVEALSQSAAGRPRITFGDLRIWGLAPAETPARVRVTLLSETAADGVSPGDRVSVLALLRPPGGPVEPGAFDFARAAWFERLGGVGVARGRLARLPDAPAAGQLAALGEALSQARARLGDGLRARLPGEAGAFAAAIVTGDRAGLPVDALEALRDSGLAHLLAISGLHMAIVCGLVFGGVRLALAASGAAAGPLAARVAARDVAAVAALAAALCYLLASGASVATQRAFVMAAVALSAVLAGRSAVTLRGLALAAWVVLLLAPETVLSVGFQMSFAATVALVAAYEAARERLTTRRRRGAAVVVGRYVVGLVATSLIAGLATAPFAAFHFNRAATYGLLANLGGVPLMGLLVAPSLAAAALLAPLGWEEPALTAAGAGIEGILAVARWTASLEGAVRAVPAAPPSALWLTTAGGLWLCLWRSRLRLAGLPVLALAGAVWAAPAPRPPLIIAEDGSVAAMTAAGRAVQQGRGGDFARATWLRRDGALGDDAPGFDEDGPAPRAALDTGWRVVVWQGGRLSRRALDRLCGPATVVVAPWAAAPESTRGGVQALSAASMEGVAWLVTPDACGVIDRRALAGTGPLVGRPVASDPDAQSASPSQSVVGAARTSLKGGAADEVGSPRTTPPAPIRQEPARPSPTRHPPSSTGGAAADERSARPTSADPPAMALRTIRKPGRLWSGAARAAGSADDQ
ncbi:ComEC/Rec2 family competence protein [Rubrimonas cliftonensis]|uniref:Competence protein ComEC n=1 Tax=Rubrimonas cliftonensis TaxID=89524 RepID=A0A1H4BER3_9RHOB|nr:ComEC/Rec2 family competence protein [Rubrimonas cliftonensis]SEA46586.1 competence protein ComEC [Rubrimonas cliftonensis]